MSEADTPVPTWSMSIPDEWIPQETEGGVILTAEPKIGELDFTSWVRDDRDFTDEDLHEICVEQLGEDAPVVPIRCGEFGGLGTAFETEDESYNIFVLRAGPQMLFITYHCALADEGKENDAVDGILATLCVESDD